MVQCFHQTQIYDLNIDQDLSDNDVGDSLGPDTDEIINIDGKMEMDSEADNDNDHSFVDPDDFGVNIVPIVHKNISWSRKTSFEPNFYHPLKDD